MNRLILLLPTKINKIVAKAIETMSQEMIKMYPVLFRSPKVLCVIFKMIKIFHLLAIKLIKIGSSLLIEISKLSYDINISLTLLQKRLQNGLLFKKMDIVLKYTHMQVLAMWQCTYNASERLGY